MFFLYQSYVFNYVLIFKYLLCNNLALIFLLGLLWFESE